MKRPEPFDLIFFVTLLLAAWVLVGDMRSPAAANTHQKSMRQQIEELSRQIEGLDQQRSDAEAISAAEKLVALAKQASGAESLDEASALSLLAKLDLESGEYSKAEALYQEALRIQRKASSGPSTSKTRCTKAD